MPAGNKDSEVKQHLVRRNHLSWGKEMHLIFVLERKEKTFAEQMEEQHTRRYYIGGDREFIVFTRPQETVAKKINKKEVYFFLLSQFRLKWSLAPWQLHKFEDPDPFPSKAPPHLRPCPRFAWSKTILSAFWPMEGGKQRVGMLLLSESPFQKLHASLLFTSHWPESICKGGWEIQCELQLFCKKLGDNLGVSSPSIKVRKWRRFEKKPVARCV